MNIKENILKTPAWKAFVCLILIMFSLGVVLEEILSHTVFHVFDRMILKMENEKIADLNDMDDISKSEQQENCKKYQWLLEEKASLQKRPPRDKNQPDVDYWFMQDHERAINFAIEHHQLNLDQCKKSLKGQTK